MNYELFIIFATKINYLKQKLTKWKRKDLT